VDNILADPVVQDIIDLARLALQKNKNDKATLDEFIVLSMARRLEPHVPDTHMICTVITRGLDGKLGERFIQKTLPIRYKYTDNSEWGKMAAEANKKNGAARHAASRNHATIILRKDFSAIESVLKIAKDNFVIVSKDGHFISANADAAGSCGRRGGRGKQKGDTSYSNEKLEAYLASGPGSDEESQVEVSLSPIAVQNPSSGNSMTLVLPPKEGASTDKKSHRQAAPSSSWSCSMDDRAPQEDAN
jgi:hypothetical protein